MIISVGELLQVIVSLLQQSDLLLQAVEQYFRLRHSFLFVRADHLLDIVVLPLYVEQKLGEYPLILLLH